MASLADDDAEQNISRAFVPYAHLYPTFQESLNRFRRGERSELLHRGAERIVHNVGLYDTRRRSEDRGADIPVILEEAVPPVFPRNVQKQRVSKARHHTTTRRSQPQEKNPFHRTAIASIKEAIL